MTSYMLDTLSTEIGSFAQSGHDHLQELLSESDSFLNDLKSMESMLVDQLKQEEAESNNHDTQNADNGTTEISTKKALPPNPAEVLEKSANSWYKSSIDSLKSYNTSVNKFSKNILNNSKFNADLDDAYTYPLNLNNFPVNTANSEDEDMNAGYNSKNGVVTDLKAIKLENRAELIKAIILHLLKIGQCDIVKEIVKELSPSSGVIIDESLLTKFERLNRIVEDIVVRHDLTKSLQWFQDKFNEKFATPSRIQLSNPVPSNFNDIEFKFHMLQFTLLLNGENSSFTLDDALAAYMYSKDNFSKFFKDYLNEISPLMTLLLFKKKNRPTHDNDDDFTRKHMESMLSSFIEKIRLSFNVERDRKKNNGNEMRFVSELLSNFEDIHSDQSLFVNISNEFISEYCKDLRLSNDSSLFQSVLAGYINLPSFYKYNQIQVKMNKLVAATTDATTKSGDEESGGSSSDLSTGEVTIVNHEATYSYDLPFQLPDSNRFLFNYHPIFICPISKEQLVPITDSADNSRDDEPKSKRKKSSTLDPGNHSLQGNPVVVLNFCQHLALRESAWQLSKKGTEIFKCHYCYKKHKFTDVTDAYFIDL
ncbi:CTLH/CRA C-terminal to lish motif domain-containing protein [Scheffersomyces xylosifermentans]|uniref:CTLH/CRA C-terminal to lish motif domain-containing protein n=1 Tax=Scheffersomyces xylosifermentans TaxID=1304137 RepID=UPI00315CAD18